MSPDMLEAALEMAIQSLSQVAATGTPTEKIDASRALVDAVETISVQIRKEKLAAQMEPLLLAVTKNLAGELSESDSWAPVFSLEPAAQGSILLQLSKDLK